MFGDDPAAAEASARALAEAMRRRRAAGTLATVIGGPFAQAGRQLSGEAGGDLESLIGAMKYRGESAFKRADDARQQAMFEETARHNKAMEGRPAPAIVVQGASGPFLVDPRKPNAPASPVRGPGGEPIGPPKPKAVDEGKPADDLRKEFQGQQGYKDFQQVSAAYKKILTTSETGAGDMSLIFGYMKLLDPNSTVREGEYATAANAGSVPQSLLASYNKVVSGEKLAPEVRKQFRDEAAKVFGAQKAQFDQLAAPYVEIARKRGLPPEDVIFGYQEPASSPPASPAASASPAPSAPAAKRPRRTAGGEVREWDGTAWVPVKGE
jgi:hypothetical protein